jgi:hypothetical protein
MIAAYEACQHSINALARIREQAALRIEELKEADPEGMGRILREVEEKIEETYLRGSFSADFKAPELFGEEKDRRSAALMNETRALLVNLGYKVEFSLSSNWCNERMFVSWNAR